MVKPDPVRDANYKSFVREDFHNWSYSMALITHLFFLPKFLIGWSIFFLAAFLNWVICLGENTQDFKIPALKCYIIRKITNWSQFFLVTIGLGIWPRTRR